MKFKIGIAAIVVIGLAFLLSIKGPGSEAKPDTSIQQTPQEVATINAAVNSLEVLAAKSPKAKKLLEFYRAHAVQAHLRTDGAVVLSESPKSEQWFAICANPTPIDLKPGERAAGAIFNTGSRVMMISPTSAGDIGRGAIFAHELSHAYDALVNGEQETPAMSDDWLFGELTAHAATMTVLNEYSNGAYLKAVSDADQARSAMKRSMKKSINSYSFGIDASDSLRMVQALGALTDADMDMLNVQFQVDVNIGPVNRSNTSKSQDEFNGRAVGMLRLLYEQSLPPEIAGAVVAQQSPQ